MKASSLPNLRGKVSNNNRLKIEITKAINAAITYAKRSAVGYSQVALDVQGMFAAASTAIRSWTRANSIAVAPTASTKAAGQTQQLAVTGTYPDGVTEAIAANDPRVTYSSATPAAATVNASGLVTAVATGSSVITVTFHGRTATYTMTVS